MKHFIAFSLLITLATLVRGQALQQTNITAKQATSKQFFIENKGQWDSRAKFVLRSGRMDLWLTDNGAVYDLYKMTPQKKVADCKDFLTDNRYLDNQKKLPNQQEQSRSGHIVKMEFEGANNTSVEAIGLEKQKTYYNYFIGNDKSKWASHVGLFASAKITNLYEDIDAVFYLDKGQPRYDIVLAPNADPSQIRMNFKGANAVKVAKDGSLILKTSMGELKQQGLLAYQMIDGKKQKVECAFKASANGRVSFKTANYNKSKGLVIDPLIWSTFLGGSGGDVGYGIALDAAGNVYTAGETTSEDFPTTVGSYQSISIPGSSYWYFGEHYVPPYEGYVAKYSFKWRFNLLFLLSR
jgi:hypothetical protein